jgi:hypothetical protein
MRGVVAAALAGGLALVLCTTTAAEPPVPPPAAGGWQALEGTWAVAGRRQVLEVEGGAVAVIVDVAGAVSLTTGSGLSRGFHGRAIGYADDQGVSLGRCVWTDEKGDRIFGRVRGEPIETGKRLIGTITGGTGRYAGIEGEFSLTWQYVVPGEDGAIQARAVALKGRFRRAGTAP